MTSIEKALQWVHTIGKRLDSHTNLASMAYAVFAVVAALGLMYYATGGRVAYTMDSLTYRDAALNFLAGHPMLVTNVGADSPQLVPSLQWPPAYPALWAFAAFVSAAGVDSIPSVLNLALLAFTTLCLYWIGLRVSGRPCVAAIAAVAVAFFPTSAVVFGHAWSETLFIPLLLLCYAAFWEYRRNPERLACLTLAAACVGAANWVRYAGAVFLPLVPLMIVIASPLGFGKRLLHAGGTALMSALVVGPLWWHNWNLTGNISGSQRGGQARHSRVLEDASAMWDLFVQPLFSFSMVLMANLAVPILAVISYLLIRAFRRREFKLARSPETWLPLVWMAAYLVFLLYARTIQQGIDMDLRMMAVAVPFLFLATVPAISASLTGRRFNAAKALLAVLIAMDAYAGYSEGQRIHGNYAQGMAPGWRANFGFGYRDFSRTAPKNIALRESIGSVEPSTVVLTDYRALYIRYLTGARAYAIPITENSCAPWMTSQAHGLILIGEKESLAWAEQCLKMNSGWRIVIPSGAAAKSDQAN